MFAVLKSAFFRLQVSPRLSFIWKEATWRQTEQQIISSELAPRQRDVPPTRTCARRDAAEGGEVEVGTKWGLNIGGSGAENLGDSKLVGCDSVCVCVYECIWSEVTHTLSTIWWAPKQVQVWSPVRGLGYGGGGLHPDRGLVGSATICNRWPVVQFRLSQSNGKEKNEGKLSADSWYTDTHTHIHTHFPHVQNQTVYSKDTHPFVHMCHIATEYFS